MAETTNETEVHGMSNAAETALRKIGSEYVESGNPGIHLIGFEPKNSNEVAAYGELQDLGFLQKRTNSSWFLTEVGVRWVLTHVHQSGP